jgi:hypothetical protein
VKKFLATVLVLLIVGVGFATSAAPPPRPKILFTGKITFDMKVTNYTEIWIDGRRATWEDVPEEGEFVEFVIREGYILKMVIKSKKERFEI